MFVRRLLSVVVSAALASAPMGPALAQQIVLDGRTNTTLNAVGSNTTNVTTTTISNGHGINAFKRFNVDAGNTVNLIQPSSTQSLINIVTGTQPTNIAGTLNAMKNGRIGGNAIIANTNGIVITKSGVVNAGKLTLTTPSREFTDRFFSADGRVSSAAVQSLQAGTESLNPIADISVHGQVHAESVAMRAGRDLNIDGVIYSKYGNMSYAANETSSTGKKAVKAAAARGLSVDRNGVVRLFAGRNLRVRGKVQAKRKTAQPSRRVGGEAYLYAAQNLTLEEAALIDVSGVGGGDGGTALLYADNNASLGKNALVSVGSDTGKGGFIEFSASKNVALEGQLSAASQSGKSGTVFIDPEHMTISGSAKI